jgi:hypothetical protein
MRASVTQMESADAIGGSGRENVERMRGGGASGKVKLAQGVPLYVLKVEEMKDADESGGRDSVAGEGEGRD